jgi:hypothetical protein
MYNELVNPSMTQFHSDLLRLARNYIDLGCAAIHEYYSRWDASLAAYEAEDPVRVKDEDAMENQRPESMAIPMTYAQVQTFKAFCSQVMDQKPRQFEAAPRGPEDADGQELGEVLLQSDLTANKWKVKRGQVLQNLGTLGLAVVRSEFEEDVIGVQMEVEDTSGTIAFGQNFGARHKIQHQKVTRRRGNRISVVSPYKYLHDPCFDICEQDRARFQGDEFEITRSELEAMEYRQEVAGVHFIPKDFPSDRWTKRMQYKTRFDYYRYNDNRNDVLCITRLQMKVVPRNIILSDGASLGDSDAPCILDVWVANDARIIKCEINGCLHGRYSYDVAAFDNEMHVTLGKSLTDMMSRLQETIDWFMNTRMESVTRNIEPQLIFDPYAVDVGDLQSGQRLIRLKKGLGRVGLDAYVKQLQVSDPTVRHMDDIAQLTRLLQEVTGVNANMSGQFHTGRRSATEAKVVTGGAASRIMTVLGEVWESLFSPLGSKLLSNLRQGLTVEDITAQAGERTPEAIASFSADPIRIATSQDFWILDGTTPSEKGFQAQWITEVFGVVMTNPLAAIQLDVSPRLLLEKGMELQGINFRDSIRMSKDPQTLQQVVMQMAQQLAQQMVASQPPAPSEPPPQ